MKRYDVLRLARLAVQIARTRVPDYANTCAPKRYMQPSLLACLSLKEFLHMNRLTRPCCAASPTTYIAPFNWDCRCLYCLSDASRLGPEVLDRA